MTVRQYDFNVAVETSEQPATGTPSGDGDLITKAYADKNYMQGRLAVADITALKALTVADLSDKHAVLVEGTNSLYRYDSGSSATGDDDLIVQPTSGSGRYFKVTEGNNVRFTRVQLDNAGELRFQEETANGSAYVGFKAPADLSGVTQVYTLPAADGDANHVLITDGNGVLSFAAQTGSGGGNDLYSAQNADYTITDIDNARTIGMTTSTTDRFVTLPTASDNADRLITVVKIDSASGNCTVEDDDGTTALIVLYSQNDFATYQSDGSNWKLVSARIATRYQVKTLGSPVTSNTTGISDLGFSNLTVGKLYRYTLRYDGALGASPAQMNLTVNHDGTQIVTYRSRFAFAGTAGNNTDLIATAGSVISKPFIATATTVTVDFSETGNGATLNASSSYGVLEELNGHAETADWA